MAIRVVMSIEDLRKAPRSVKTVELVGEENISAPDDRRTRHGTGVVLSGPRHLLVHDPHLLRVVRVS